MIYHFFLKNVSKTKKPHVPNIYIFIHLALQGVAHDVILDGHSCSKSCKDFIDQAD